MSDRGCSKGLATPDKNWEADATVSGEATRAELVERRGAPESRADVEVAAIPYPEAEGCHFHCSDASIWARYPGPARFNPPEACLPLPKEFYGQPFFRGFDWEKKV